MNKIVFLPVFRNFGIILEVTCQTAQNSERTNPIHKFLKLFLIHMRVVRGSY